MEQGNELHSKITEEVIRLHKFFSEWFQGVHPVEQQDTILAQHMGAYLSDGFQIVGPKGNLSNKYKYSLFLFSLNKSTRTEIVATFKTCHGRWASDQTIEIEHVKVHSFHPEKHDVVLCTYVEVHASPALKKRRQSSVCSLSSNATRYTITRTHAQHTASHHMQRHYYAQGNTPHNTTHNPRPLTLHPYTLTPTLHHYNANTQKGGVR